MMTNPDILLTLKFGERLFTDPRRIALLKAIVQTGSLSQAAKSIGISYKTAWDAVNEINQLSAQPFIITATGGKGGGGAKLSDYAVRFVALYDLLTNMQSRAFNLLKDESVPINDILKAVATVSLQSSARNQLYGMIETIKVNKVAGFITILLQDRQTQLQAYITQSSIERLQLSVGKNVMLLIKAPQVELVGSDKDNHYLVNVDKITLSDNWCELTLSLSRTLTLYATRPIEELKQFNIKQGQSLDIYIHPENIIVAAMV